MWTQGPAYCRGPVIQTLKPGLKRQWRECMQPEYHIVLRMRAGTELECFGQFKLNAPRKCMEKIYAEMKGLKDGGEELPIQLDLVQVTNGLPETLHIVACTLEELLCNVKVIARETFKILNLIEPL